ncbi:MAG TPA: glycoside hydrolase family 3 C-terminal domain-containing protein [Steroidobacteraceae bacterium]
MRSGIITVGVLLPFAAPAQQAATSQSRPWLNPQLPLGRRVDALVLQMTLEEKVGQMQDHAPAIARLGVPPYEWWNEGLHGVAFAGYATNFPQVIGMAATWDAPLVHHMGQIISTEARAKYNEAIREDDHERFFGLTFWAPNINIFRDPRWGRGQESYGEDPFLTARMAVAFVTGMQGDDSRYLRVVSTPKHFAVHSGPEPSRHSFNVNVSPHDLEETYLPAFRAAITEGHAQSTMCAYNAVDGTPDCANSQLLRDHLRRDWHFDGYVVSDCAAVADVNTGHHFASDMAHAAALALKAGTDLECGFREGLAFPALVQAVRLGLVHEADLDIALHRLFRARFALGMFDPPASFAYGRIPFSVVNSPKSRQQSLQAARESMVLLKNTGDILPLKADIANIAVIGPTAELLQSMQGNYNGPPPAPVYPLNGIERRFAHARIHYAQGATLVDGMAMPIEHTALRPATGSGYGLQAEYFPTVDLSGSAAVTRIDRNINFNWDKAIPVRGLHRDNYSVRWTGSFVPPGPGDYKLGVRINYCYSCENAEKFRLYVDGRKILESTDKATGERGAVLETPLHFDDTRPHPIRLEYFHGGGSAGIDLTWQAPAPALREEALRAVRDSDVVVAFVGLSTNLEGEQMPVSLTGFSGGDRTSIELPTAQEALLEAVGASGKPLVVVLQNGSPLAVTWAAKHAGAILEAWYPGEEGGTAIAETLAGINNPAGRLPLTFYASTSQLPAFSDYSMKGRTYRYFKGEPLFSFGYGLSYTRFAYSKLTLPQQVSAGAPVPVQVDVTNAGSASGDEVVELYLTKPKVSEGPIRELVGFRRIHLEPGKRSHVELSIDPRALGEVDAAGNRVIVPGSYSVSIGGSQPAEGSGVLSGEFNITGRSDLPR